MRIPKHIGIIPDGNRRWALGKGMEKEAGYDNGISPGMVLYHLCRKLGINEMKPYTNRHQFGNGGMKINFLVNYSWEWDLGLQDGAIGPKLKTADVSRIDLVIRWGGRRRLSGFLPVQSVYSDMYVIDDYWPDFTPQHVYDAIEWYSKQDVTLGG